MPTGFEAKDYTGRMPFMLPSAKVIIIQYLYSSQVHLQVKIRKTFIIKLLAEYVSCMCEYTVFHVSYVPVFRLQ